MRFEIQRKTQIAKSVWVRLDDCISWATALLIALQQRTQYSSPGQLSLHLSIFLSLLPFQPVVAEQARLHLNQPPLLTWYVLTWTWDVLVGGTFWLTGTFWPITLGRFDGNRLDVLTGYRSIQVGCTNFAIFKQYLDYAWETIEGHGIVIGNHTHFIEPWRFRWPWLTFEGHFGYLLTVVFLCA